MIKLNAQIGSNPLRYHTPKQYKTTPTHTLSIGQTGQLTIWQTEPLTPIYQLLPSALADTDGLIDTIITPLRLITNQHKNLKIITLHNDDRLRIYTLEDGLCVSISQHGLLPEKMGGIVECQGQGRFFGVYGERTVYLVDSWTMKIVDVYQPKMDSFSVLVKARFNAKYELELMDKHSKIYRIKFDKIFEEVHLDVGNWLSNPIKAHKILVGALQKIKEQPVVTSYKKIPEPDLGDLPTRIQGKLKDIRARNVWEDIFDVERYGNWEILKYLCKLEDEEPVVSNCFFLKGSKIWYFFGTNKGRIIGIPAIMKQSQQIIISNPNEISSPVAYLSFIQNLLITSWQNGTFNIYTTDNLEYTIQATINAARITHQNSFLPLPLVHVNLNQTKVLNQKLSSPIKYKLQIYSLSHGKLSNQTLAFQLMNNQVVIFQALQRKLSHYRGILQNYKIYAVLDMQDYIGIAHGGGVDVYSGDRFQRMLGYGGWVWSQFQLCDQFKCKDDYNNIYSRVPGGQNSQTDLSSVNATLMFQHAQRLYHKKIDYTQPNLSLLYQTFGPMQSQSLPNQLYPQIHFLQRIFSQRTIHSTSTQSATSIVRIKLSNVRRQKLTNTTYILSCDLNRQLEIFLGGKHVPIDKIGEALEVFALFFWEDQQGLALGDMFLEEDFKFVVRRRFAEQGVGRSFTIYFDNKFKNSLSSQLITYSSVATVSMLQICSTKNIQLAEQMANAVQYYTVRRKQSQVKPNVQTLSRLCLTQSHPTLKSCINILMSTSLTQQVPLHPVNDYFLLNLKNIQQTSSPLLTQTQTIWFVYLGIGFIYSNQQCDKEQVKKLIERLVRTIDLRNFQNRADLVQIVLRVFNQGVKKWRNMISSNMVVRIFLELIRVFFCYDGLAAVQPDDKKFNFIFENTPIPQNKKMKQQIVKTIIYLSKQFTNQFLQVIKIQALNQKPHSCYPASVVQILRQYIKAQKPQTNLVFYIQLLLQCLSPMTPQLRKHVQKNVLATLQLMCSYQNISFNQPSQKLSLRTDSNIYIYCLRTSTKWRTISLKDEKVSQHSIIEMSPKGTYIAFLGEKLRIWRLSSGFWSGVLGAFSQGWTFDVEGKEIKWDEKEEYITVIHQNPSENKCFKL